MKRPARSLYSKQTGKLDIFVAGIGTGGTITGTARYLKKHLPQVHTVGLEPATSPLITQGKSGAHGLQGIGANFIPKNYDASVVDEVLTVTDEEAYKMAKLLARTEGILVGITSGAALAAAVRLLRMPENAKKRSWRFCPTAATVIFPPRSLNKRKGISFYGKKILRRPRRAKNRHF